MLDKQLIYLDLLLIEAKPIQILLHPHAGHLPKLFIPATNLSTQQPIQLNDIAGIFIK